MNRNPLFASSGRGFLFVRLRKSFSKIVLPTKPKRVQLGIPEMEAQPHRFA